MLAQTQAATQTRSYTVPAGELASALRSVASTAGVPITFTSAQTDGKTTAGLQGEYSVNEAFAALLAGTDLQAVRLDNGGYVLQPATTAGVTMLRKVRVEALLPVFDTGATEGSGSYAASEVNSATGLALSPRRTPHSLSVVTREQMDEQNLTSLVDVMAQVPGIKINHLDSERWNMSARGGDLNMMIDGSMAPGYLGGPSGEVHMINTATLDRVEVVRGSTGLLNGTGSYGGSVNLVRKRPLGGFHPQGSFSIGSWDRYLAQFDASVDLNEAGSVRSRWVVATEEGGSFTADYDRSERTFYGILEADLAANTTVSLGIDRFAGDVDGSSFSHIPMFFEDGTRFEAPHSFNPAPPWTSTEVGNLTVFADLEHRFATDWTLDVAASWLNSESDVVRAGFSPWQGLIEVDTGMAPIFRSLLYQQADRYTLDARLSGAFEAFGRRHDLIFGANYHENHLGDHRTRFFFDDGSASVNIHDWPRDLPPYPNPNDADTAYAMPEKSRYSAVFGAAQLRLFEPLAAIVGTRWQRYEYERREIDLATLDTSTSTLKESGELVPYAALLYDLTAGTTAYVSYSSIFKPQEVLDRNGEVLPPEKGINYEVGVKAEFFDGRLQPGVSFYRQQTDNFAVEDPGFVQPDGESAYRAVNGAVSKGWDVTIAGEPLTGWTLQGGFGASLNDGERSESRFFTLTSSWAASEKFSIGGNLTGYPKRRVEIDYSEATYELPSVTLLNLFASYRITDTLRLFLNVENVTNERYMESAGTYGTYIYGPDRNFMLRLRYGRSM